jgi:peptidoglycan/xylan/chitin deacetylase (PgdA/CDA1 family)
MRAAGALVLAVVVALAVALSAGDLDVTTPGTPATSTTTTEPREPSTAPVPTAATTVTTAAPPTSTAPTPAPPVSTRPAVPVWRGDPDRQVVALTFDAGSDLGHAAEILDALATNGVPATFGITGRWAEAHPALVRRMAAEGHQLVNHSYDHPSFTGFSTGEAPLSRAARLDQLARAEAAIRAAAGVSSLPWFRPPYGDEDESVRADVGSAGYRYELMWTLDSLGWTGLPAEQVVARCLDGAVPGAIYLMHVGAASTDHAALQRVIDGLRAQGYSFTTADGLAG